MPKYASRRNLKKMYTSIFLIHEKTEVKCERKQMGGGGDMLMCIWFSFDVCQSIYYTRINPRVFYLRVLIYYFTILSQNIFLSTTRHLKHRVFAYHSIRADQTNFVQNVKLTVSLWCSLHSQKYKFTKTSFAIHSTLKHKMIFTHQHCWLHIDVGN